MMIFLVESNELTKIEISWGSLYQMNQMKTNLRLKQQRYTMTRSKIRRGELPKKNQPRILFRERVRKKLTIGKNNLVTSG